MKKTICMACIAVLCVFTTIVNAENLIVKQAREAGIKHCLPAIEKIANFLDSDSKAGVHSIWNKNNPDKQAFSAVIERNYSDGDIIINLNVTPVPTGECYVEYEKIIQFNKSCLATSKEFKNAEYKAEINKNVSLLDQDGVYIYLIPAGSNCIVLRKEAIMDGLKL